MADINNGFNTMPIKCIKISNKFIKAINKHGIMMNFLKLKSKQPENQYESLYGQSKPLIEKDIQFKVLLNVNPSEDVYKDLHFETRGNALIYFMAYSLQLLGLIGDSLNDYVDIPNVLIGNHVRFGNDYYRIDEVKQTDIYMGFPLHQICSLTFIETKE